MEMETYHERLYRKIININLIRQCIYKNIASADDISNFSKLSRETYYYAIEDVVKRNLKYYRDVQEIVIKPIQRDISHNVPLKLKDIVFEMDENILSIFDDVKKFKGETVRNWNCITISINNIVQRLKRYDRVPFFKKLAKEMNIDCDIRKDAKILNFILFSSPDYQMLLYTLGYMKHDKIERITIPSIVFMSKVVHPKKLKCSIFEGFPNLYELSIFISPGHDYLQSDFVNEDIMDHVFKEFSNKKGAKIILDDTDFAYESAPHFVNLILRLAKKYQIKISCKGYFLFSKINSFTVPNEIDNVLTKELLTSVEFSIPSSSMFPKLMKQLESLSNLKKLGLQFHFFVVRDTFFKVGMETFNCTSLKNSTTLKEVKLVFSDYSLFFDLCDGFDETEHTIIDNIKFISSLMPKSVEKLELWYINSMSKEVSDVIAEYMPNIKILKTYKVKSRDANWLLSFKNLQVYISHDKDIIAIPNSVQFLSIKNNDIYGRSNEEPLEQTVIDYYSGKFSKCYNNENNEFFFFDKFEQWASFKHSIHKF